MFDLWYNPPMEERRNTDTGQLIVDWREIFELRLEPLRSEMSMVRRALEKLSEGMISAQEWQRMNEQGNAREIKIKALEDRVEELEHYHAVGMWGFRIVAGISTAVATAALITYLVG